MKTGRPLVRLMAAMIFAIIASVATSAVQAHEGHAYHGHRHAATAQETLPVAATGAPDIGVPTTARATVRPSVHVTAIGGSQVPGAKPVASIRTDGTGAGCCAGICKGRFCGTMGCCASGILSSHAPLPMPAHGRVTLRAHDVAGLAGIGLEALPEPPRTLA